MQRENINTDTIGFDFHFEARDGSAQKACRVRVKAPNFQDAENVFQKNRRFMEQLACDSLLLASDASTFRITILY